MNFNNVLNFIAENNIEITHNADIIRGNNFFMFSVSPRLTGLLYNITAVPYSVVIANSIQIKSSE